MTTEHGFDIPTTEAWCGRLQREHPELAIEILGIFPAAGGEMLETVRISGDRPARAIESIRFTDAVRRSEIIHVGEDACTLRILSPKCGACLAAQDAGVAPVFPLRVSGGDCHWRIQTTPERARRFVTLLEDADQAPMLTRKRAVDRASILTPRQLEVLGAAVAQGYYAHPRRITLTQLAGYMGVRKSSMSQMLAIIEAKLLPRWTEHLTESQGR